MESFLNQPSLGGIGGQDNGVLEQLQQQYAQLAQQQQQMMQQQMMQQQTAGQQNNGGGIGGLFNQGGQQNPMLGASTMGQPQAPGMPSNLSSDIMSAGQFLGGAAPNPAPTQTLAPVAPPIAPPVAPPTLGSSLSGMGPASELTGQEQNQFGSMTGNFNDPSNINAPTQGQSIFNNPVQGQGISNNPAMDQRYQQLMQQYQQARQTPTPMQNNFQSGMGQMGGMNNLFGRAFAGKTI